ncbi:MAG: ABC transporter permease [Candidatus Hinthialibacteria bacterium]|nr:carbohydrate ABC transporter permease [bacterium]
MLPFFWMLSTSLKSDAEMFSTAWFPDPVQWSNYTEALSAIPFLLYLKNTLLITAWSIIGTVFSSAAVGYSFARVRWPGRDLMFGITLATMMIPPQVTMVPVFMLMRSLGWFNTFLPLVIPSFLGGSAFFIFLMRQFFMTLPVDLEDAARVDGCGILKTFWVIMLPQVKPALATVGIFTFMASWNDFMGPLIYLAEEDKYTLALGLQSFLTENLAVWNQLMAFSTVLLIPLLILFFIAQKYFIEGIALTGIKG